MFDCRRRALHRKGVSGLYLDNGGTQCKSLASITQTFKNDGKEECMDGNGINPHSLMGIFYHTHEYDEKYNFDRRYNKNPNKNKDDC